MIAAERLENIISQLREKHVVSTLKLSAQLNVTAMTIRRDLVQLEYMGFCKRTHGGAIALGRPVLQETPYTERELLCVLEKIAIAKQAFNLINEGETIALDSGTTTLQLAKLLKEKRNITVLTNSVHAILELYGCRDVRVISTAGFLSNATYAGEGKGDPCFVGPLAEETLKRFRPTKAFIGTSGLTVTDGISNSVIDEATMKRAMIDVASEVILLADHTKFGHTAASIVGPVTLIDSLITDNQITKDFEDSLTEMGVNVIKVNPE